MSSGADCQFKEVEPGVWKYDLQRYPYGESEAYDTFGPFRSFRAARDHLDQNHQNPGGWMVREHPTDHRHEWLMETGAYVPSGVEVTIRIDSLGPTPTDEAVLKLIRSQKVTLEHLNIKPVTRWSRDAHVTSCEACGEEKK